MESWETPGLIHIASAGTYEINYYIWCYGEDTTLAWRRMSPDTTPTCLRCIAAGPKGEWKQNQMFGRPGVEMMIEGKKFLVLDTETKTKP